MKFKMNHRAMLADSLYRYAIRHKDNFHDAVDLYNGWIRNMLVSSELNVYESEIPYLLHQCEICLKTPVEQLMTCIDVQDKINFGLCK